MAKPTGKPTYIEWSLRNERQLEFLRACGMSYYFDNLPGPTRPLARVILFGGSAGGGKSDAILIAALCGAKAFPKSNTVIFRRTYPQLANPGGVIMRSHELYSKLAKYHGGDRRWTLNENKSVIEFNYCAIDSDVYGYQSSQFDFLYIDESVQMSEFQIRYLLTRNRATVDGVVPFCAMATNPGGQSHGFHRKFFVDAGPPGVPVDVEIEKGRYQRHIFIPSRLSDNVILEERDPGYRNTLESMPEDIRRALLDGDWDVFAGQYFKTFSREKHVIDPIKIPDTHRRFGSIDWGYAAPCAVLWHAIEPSSGRIYTYRELYIKEHRAAEVANLIKKLSKDEEILYFKMSPDAWHERGLGSKASPGEVIAEEFTKKGINVEIADNRRVIGWQRVREYMSDAPDGKPYWQIFNTCSNTIRTLPELVHDQRKVEDIDDSGEDHAAESLRYGLMSRPSPYDGTMFHPGAAVHFKQYSEEEDDDYQDTFGDDVESVYSL